jgi:Dockerin type I domain
MLHMPRVFRLLIIVISFAASQTLSMAQSDTTPPSLVALSLGASSVNVSTAAQNLTVNATVTDDLSGVDYGYITFTSPTFQGVTGSFGRTSGTNLNGVYRATATFPKFVGAGAWTASVYLVDNAGNSIRLQSATLVSLGFPGTLTVVDATPDTTPPTLLGASFSPSTINTSAGPQSVTLSLQVSDSQSGVSFSGNYSFVTLSPVGAAGTGPYQYLSTRDFQLVSGTPQDGVWQVTKIMPQYSGGNWEITQLELWDAVTNEIGLTSAQLVAMGINPILTDTSVPVDSTPPTLTGLSFAPAVVNTGASSQNVTLTVAASDDISGVDFSPSTTSIAYIQFLFTSPSGNQSIFVNPSIIPPLVAGTPLAGTWQPTAQWPQYSEQGTWNLSTCFIKDKVGNQTRYTPAQLTALGFPSTIVVEYPSLTPDGTIGPAGGTVDDNSFGTRASINFPPGLVPPNDSVSVSIDVFPSQLSVPTPQGFTVPGTYFENISFQLSGPSVGPGQTLPEPLPAPGITVVLPLLMPMTPGAHLSLYHIDPILGLAPAMNASGNPVVGTVDAGGVSATFNNVVTFSTVVAYLSTGSILGDVNGDGVVNCADVSILKSSFGTHTGQAGFNIAADLNNDGTVNILDLFIVSRQLKAGTVCQ